MSQAKGDRASGLTAAKAEVQIQGAATKASGKRSAFHRQTPLSGLSPTLRMRITLQLPHPSQESKETPSKRSRCSETHKLAPAESSTSTVSARRS